MRAIFNFIKSIFLYLFGFFKKTAFHVSDLNGDGKVDEEEARIAAEWTRKRAGSIANEAGNLGKSVIRSEMVRDVSISAIVLGVIFIFIPFVGPMLGAALGAALGLYKNLTKTGQPVPIVIERGEIPKDIYAELLKLDDLRQKKIISEEEFTSRKKKILEGGN